MRWSDEDLDYLREYYASATPRQMMKRLKRGWEGIRSAGSLNGIKRPRFKGLLFYQDGKPKYRTLKNGCWEWIAGCNKKGYPVGRGGGETTLIYRQIYIDLKGSIPAGLEVDHTCRFRRCINPDHLEAVTHETNIRRNKRTILTPEKVALIRSAPAAMTTAKLAASLNVTYNAVYFARKGDSWRTQ